jgi:hypothetical protein
MLDFYNVDAQFHQEVKTRYGVAYRVKVLVPDHGFWINGMMVYPPNVDHPEWGVNPPGIPKQPGKFVVEFNKENGTLWKEVEKKCLEVAQLHHSYTDDSANVDSPKTPFKKDVVITDIPDGPITLDDIPDF